MSELAAPSQLFDLAPPKMPTSCKDTMIRRLAATNATWKQLAHCIVHLIFHCGKESSSPGKISQKPSCSLRVLSIKRWNTINTKYRMHLMKNLRQRFDGVEIACSIVNDLILGMSLE